MKPIEIIVIICVVLIFVAVIGRYIYKRVHHMPTGECACCKNRMQHAIKECQKDMKKLQKKSQ